jgi:hypothetical protein
VQTTSETDICGAGKVLQTPARRGLLRQPAAEHIWEGVSSATTRSRPIINTRDEPHAVRVPLRRRAAAGGKLAGQARPLLEVSEQFPGQPAGRPRCWPTGLPVERAAAPLMKVHPQVHDEGHAAGREDSPQGVRGDAAEE